MNYILEFKDSLREPGWTVLSIASGDGRTITFTDSSATSGSRFYRIRVEWR